MRRIWTPRRELVFPRHARRAEPHGRLCNLFTPAPMVGSHFKVGAVDFDGTNDYMRRLGGLTGAVDGKEGLMSFWVRMDGGDNTLQRIFCTTTTLGGGSAQLQVRVSRSSGNTFLIAGADAGGTTGTLQIGSSGSKTAGATWWHVLAAWDVSVPTLQMYVNDVSDRPTAVSTNTVQDHTGGDAGVGGNPDGASKLNGAMAEFYWATEFLDISVEANRRKFRDADGKPVSIGGDGSLVTGTAPLVYLGIRPNEAAANFATNRGTGGNFSITGSLDLASSSPSD